MDCSLYVFYTNGHKFQLHINKQVASAIRTEIKSDMQEAEEKKKHLSIFELQIK